MLIEKGEKLHLIARRRFDTDLRRHFIGEVLEAGETAVRARGFVFVLDRNTNQYIKRPGERVRIISLVDAGNIINLLPAEADLAQAEYSQSYERRLIIGDGKTFSLDVNEFSTSN